MPRSPLVSLPRGIAAATGREERQARGETALDRRGLFTGAAAFTGTAAVGAPPIAGER